MNPAFRLAWLPALVVVPKCAQRLQETTCWLDGWAVSDDTAHVDRQA
jgi:hypothetical protein